MVKDEPNRNRDPTQSALYLKFPANTIHFRHLLRLVNMQSSRELRVSRGGRKEGEKKERKSPVKYSAKKRRVHFQFAQQPVLASERRRRWNRCQVIKVDDKCARSGGHTNEQTSMLGTSKAFGSCAIKVRSECGANASKGQLSGNLWCTVWAFAPHSDWTCSQPLRHELLYDSQLLC